MENLNITDDELQNLSVEDIAELKVEVDELLHKANTLLDECDNELNS